MSEEEVKPEEPQEEETTVHEASHEQPAEAEAEQPPPPQEEPKIEPAPAPEPPETTEPTEPQKEEEKVETEKERPSEVAPPGEEQKRRRSSTKRASIDARAKASPEALDTFIPPESRGLSVSSDRRPSSSPMRRTSVGKSPSVARKSKFGGLSSKARMVLGSIVDIKGNVAEYFDKKSAKYQNTYQLESENPFNHEKVDKVLKEVMNEIIENLTYDSDKCASTAKFASTQIRTKVKQLEFDRYKLVCVVTIGEKNSQDVYATCRFLWDPEKDRYSFYSLENTHVYAIAYCFGLYYE